MSGGVPAFYSFLHRPPIVIVGMCVCKANFSCCSNAAITCTTIFYSPSRDESMKVEKFSNQSKLVAKDLMIQLVSRELLFCWIINRRRFIDKFILEFK